MNDFKLKKLKIERHNLVRLLVFAMLFILVQISAYADAGLPMIMIVWPGFIFALFPVIFIETVVLMKYLHLPLKQATIATLVSNSVSTFLGIPITWLILVIFQMFTGGGGFSYDFNSILGKVLAVTWQAPWLLPYPNSELKWMVPTAIVVLMIPFFCASWFSELFVARVLLKKQKIEKTRLRKAVFWANILSYIFLELVVLAYAIYLTVIYKS